MKKDLFRISHIIAAVIILLHAFDKLEATGHISLFYIITGIFVLTLSISHEFIIRQVPLTMFFIPFFEGTMLFLISLELFESEKEYLPWIFIALSMIYIFVSLRFFKKRH